MLVGGGRAGGAGPCLELLTTPDLVNRIFSNPSAHKHLHIIYLKYVQVEYWRHPALSLSPSSPSIQVSKHPGLLYHNYEGFGSQPGLDAV